MSLLEQHRKLFKGFSLKPVLENLACLTGTSVFCTLRTEVQMTIQFSRCLESQALLFSP